MPAIASRMSALAYCMLADLVCVLEQIERNAARTAARTSMGLPPLTPPHEFLCPVTQAAQRAQSAVLVRHSPALSLDRRRMSLASCG